MEKSVTLDPPGTGERCTLKERPYASSWRARAEAGDSDVYGATMLLPLGGRARGGWRRGGR